MPSRPPQRRILRIALALIVLPSIALTTLAVAYVGTEHRRVEEARKNDLARVHIGLARWVGDIVAGRASRLRDLLSGSGATEEDLRDWVEGDPLLEAACWHDGNLLRFPPDPWLPEDPASPPDAATREGLRAEAASDTAEAERRFREGMEAGDGTSAALARLGLARVLWRRGRDQEAWALLHGLVEEESMSSTDPEGWPLPIAALLLMRTMAPEIGRSREAVDASLLTRQPELARADPLAARYILDRIERTPSTDTEPKLFEGIRAALDRLRAAGGSAWRPVPLPGDAGGRVLHGGALPGGRGLAGLVPDLDGIAESIVGAAREQGMEGTLVRVPAVSDDPLVRTGPLPILPGWNLRVRLPVAVGDPLARRNAPVIYAAIALLLLSIAAGSVLAVREVRREALTARLRAETVTALSHEIKTPLTSMRMFVDTLRMGRIGSEAQRRECLDAIGRESGRLAHLAERMLDVARLEAGLANFNAGPVDLRGTVRDAATAAAGVFEEHGVSLDLHLPPAPVVVRGDAEALTEAVLNLLANAAQYSPPGSRTVLHLGAAGGTAELRVKDQGEGIPRGERKQIFERYARGSGAAARRRKGTGLGLALVRHMVEAHGGKVDVTSRVGVGSTFRVRLPLWEGS